MLRYGGNQALESEAPVEQAPNQAPNGLGEKPSTEFSAKGTSTSYDPDNEKIPGPPKPKGPDPIKIA